MIAQFLLDQALRIRIDSTTSLLRYRLIMKVLRGIAHLGDPLVRYALAGGEVLLPASHRLPDYRKMFPQYSENIGRIGKAVHQKYPAMTLIDLGANVGDTVFILRGYDHYPILCIEGDDRFAKILAHNVAYLSDIKIINCFIGETRGTLKIVKNYHYGTLRLKGDREGGEHVRFETLSKVLESELAFSDPRMIKIDTDGYDCRIIKCELPLIQKLTPVLYFEYDPSLFLYPKEGLELLGKLHEAGYQSLLIYDNVGDFLIGSNLSNSQLLRDIDHYFSGWEGLKYCDLCVFHELDEGIFEDIHQQELSLTTLRSSPPSP